MLGFDAVAMLALGQMDLEDEHDVTSTATIQLPVDCVLAGQQLGFRQGSANYSALRSIFRE